MGEERVADDKAIGRTTGPPAQLLAIVGRVTAVAADLAGRVRRLAAVAALAAAAIWLVLLDGRWPISAREGAVLAAVLVALLAPSLVLLAYYRTLRQVLAVSNRLCELRSVAAAHVADLNRLAEEVRGSRQGGRFRLLVTLWELRGLLRSAREQLAVYTPVAAAVSPPFLIAVATAAAIAMAEVGVAAAAVVWALLA